ncbi:uncharacterized protein C12orf45-like [Argonauta hians]
MERNGKAATSVSRELLQTENNSKYPDCLLVNKHQKCENVKTVPKICAMEKSSVLASVQKFLPELAKANAKLSKENLSDLNIENISENDQNVIEMNLNMFQYETSSSCDSDKEDSSEEEVPYWGEVDESNIRTSHIKSRKPKTRNTLIEEITNRLQ